MDFRTNSYSRTDGQQRNQKHSNESEVIPNESETRLVDAQGPGSNPDRSDPEEKDEEEKQQVPSDQDLNALSHSIN